GAPPRPGAVHRRPGARPRGRWRARAPTRPRAPAPPATRQSARDRTPGFRPEAGRVVASWLPLLLLPGVVETPAPANLDLGPLGDEHRGRRRRREVRPRGSVCQPRVELERPRRGVPDTPRRVTHLVLAGRPVAPRRVAPVVLDGELRFGSRRRRR